MIKLKTSSLGKYEVRQGESGQNCFIKVFFKGHYEHYIVVMWKKTTELPVKELYIHYSLVSGSSK